MFFVLAFGIDKDVIKIYYHENVELLCQNLVDITLECGQCISQSKKHDLVLEVAIADPEGCLPFFSFPNPHLIVGIGQIELS